MRMSISTTSGRVRWHSSTPSRPFSASPTTSMSGWASRIMREAVAHQRLVVDDRDSDGHRALASARSRAGRVARRRRRVDDRQHGAHGVAAAASRSRRELATVDLDPLAHADQAVPGARRRDSDGGRAAPVVGDLDHERVRSRRRCARWPTPTARRACARWSAPPARSGRRPARCPGASGRWSPSTTSSVATPARRRLLDRGGDVGDARLRRQRRCRRRRSRAARRACAAARRATRVRPLSIRGEHLGRLVGVGVHDLPPGGRLHGDRRSCRGPRRRASRGRSGCARWTTARSASARRSASAAAARRSVSTKIRSRLRMITPAAIARQEADHAQRGEVGEAVRAVEQAHARRDQQHDARRRHRPPRPPAMLGVGGDRVQRRQAEHRQERAVVAQPERDEDGGHDRQHGDRCPPPPASG